MRALAARGNDEAAVTVVKGDAVANTALAGSRAMTGSGDTAALPEFVVFVVPLPAPIPPPGEVE